ncbi:DUF3489 domain-containing protein [Roseomonas sp. BN140053]|uniref:DUF3489 domain-containing protein n=1 Tax=Roseomonas sp. BN140053 TaxID=3391898 RepID=UPI0039EBFEDC
MVKQSHIATLPDIPAPPRQAVIASLLKTGLRAQAPAPAGETEPERSLAQPDPPGTGADLGGVQATQPPAHALGSVRAAAQAVLAAWDARGTPNTLSAAVERLRAAVVRRPAQPSTNGPRTGTKHAIVLALLRRPEGATVTQLIEVTGWAPHTVRGFLAGLKRRGTPVEVLERVRQVGSGRAGAKGSYSVYRVAEAG